MNAGFEDAFVRVCPDCNAEFVATVESCYDCGTALVTRPADEPPTPGQAARAAAAAGAGPPKPADDQPPAGWIAIETADLDWAVELKSRLAASGIATGLAQDCASCKPTLSVYVAPADLAAARGVARDLYLEKVPEAGSAATEPLAADRCPSCGAPAPETAAACPDCGLAFLAPGGLDDARDPADS